MSPSVSRKQQRLMGADLARKRTGKKTKTGMSEKQLEEYASMPHKGMPEKKQPMHKMPGGHMMKDSEMEKTMKGKMSSKKMAPKKKR